MIKVAITEDQLLFRKGFVQLIDSFKNMRVEIEVSNGRELLEALRKDSVDLVILDVNMPVMGGLDSIKILKKEYPSVKVIFLTVFEDEAIIAKLIEAGANAYLGKNSELNEVEITIRKVMENDYYFSEKAINAMHSKLQNKKKTESNPLLASITKREREILQLICKEYTSEEISRKLFITESTVNGHRNNLLLKLNCKNTAGLVMFSVKNGILD